MSVPPEKITQIEISVETEERKRCVQTLSLIKAHAPWVFPIIIAIASFLGILNLWGFTHFIGRPDVFLASLETGSSLFLFTIYSSFSYIAFSLFFLWALLFFLKTLKDIKVTVPVKTAIFGFLGMIVFDDLIIILANMPPGSGGPMGNTCLYLALPLSSLVALLFISKDKTAWETIILPTISAAFLAFFSSIFSLMLLKSFNENNVSALDAILIWLLLSVSSLLPVVLYHLSEENSKKTHNSNGKSEKIKWTFVGVMLWQIISFVFLPGFFPAISVNSMVVTGVADQKTRQYIIDNRQYPIDSLDKVTWRLEPTANENKYRITALSLYAYGSINLLCPANIARFFEPKQNLGEIKKFTCACVPFQKDDIRKLEEFLPQQAHANITNNSNQSSLMAACNQEQG